MICAVEKERRGLALDLLGLVVEAIDFSLSFRPSYGSI